MFKDELLEIKRVEGQADEKLKKAKIDAKSIVEEAKSKATEILEKADIDAKGEFKKHTEKGENKAKENYDKFIEETKTSVTEIRTKADKNISKATDLIKERIAGAYVNS